MVVKRLEVTRRLQQNPSDISAQQTLCYIEKQVLKQLASYTPPRSMFDHRILNSFPQTKEWAQSQLKPGQFTGQPSLTPLSKDDHNTGLQAWAKKVTLLELAL